MKKILKKNTSPKKAKIEKKKEIRKKVNIKKNPKNKINSKEINSIIKQKPNIEDKNKIKSLIRAIFNIKEIRKQLYFMGIDYKSIQLNKIDELLKSCCNLLDKIDEIINSKDMNHKSKKDKFFNLTKEYYKLLPHTFPLPDYNLYIINDIDKIKREICLLELVKSYSELEKAYYKIRNEKDENDLNSMNLNDSMNISVNLENIPEEEHHSNISNYFFEKALSELNYPINVVQYKSKIYNDITYLINAYSEEKEGPFLPLNILEIFSLNDSNKKIDKDTLYFYGCEIIHFYSILKNGLRLPLKEAPKNVYSYGKGILLSDNPFDQIKKCLPKNNIFYLFICKVDHFKPRRVHKPHKNFPKNLDKEFNSVLLINKIYYQSNGSSDENSREHINIYNHIIYDTELVELYYIVKLQIP